MKFVESLLYVLGFLVGRGSWSHFSSVAKVLERADGFLGLDSGIGVALIAVFWAYDGWSTLGWAAGEVKHRSAISRGPW